MMFGASLASQEKAYVIKLIFTKVALPFALLLMIPVGLFLDFRNCFIPPYYERRQRFSIKVRFAVYSSIIISAIITFRIQIEVENRLFFLILFVSMPIIFYCHFAYKYAIENQKNNYDFGNSTISNGFEQTIYFPAFLVCTTSILYGIIWGSASYGDYVFLSNDRYYFPALISVLNLVIIISYYVFRIKSKYIHVLIPSFCIFTFYIISHHFPIIDGSKYILCVYALTYALGLAETIKHAYFVKRAHRLSEQSREKSVQYYMRGISWASVVFPTAMLIIPSISSEVTLIPLVILAYIIVMSWLFTSKENKINYSLIYCSLYLISSIAFFALSATKHMGTEALPGFGETNFKLTATFSFLTTFGATLTMLRSSKDVFGLHLHKFFENIYNSKMYDTSLGSYMLLLLVSVLYCGIATCVWFGLAFFDLGPENHEAYVLAVNLLLSCVSVLMLAVICVIVVIVTPVILRRFLEEASAINQMTNNETGNGPPSEGGGSAQPPPLSLMRHLWDKGYLVVISGRPTLSLIAGAAAAAMLIHIRPVSECAAIFLAMSAVTMVSFIVNDMFDIDKDRAARKSRPIATGELAKVEAGLGSGVLLMISLCCAYWFSSPASAAIVLAICVAATAYSPISRTLPLLKGLYTAALVLTPFILSSATAGVHPPLFVYAALFIFVTFRELALDAADLDGDQFVGIRTWAYYLGGNTAFYIGMFGMLFGALFATLHAAPSTSSLFFWVALAIQVTVMIVSMIDRRAALSLSRLVFLAGVLAVVNYA